MADDKHDDLSPEEIEFQDQISEETTPESMTRALRRRTSMLGSANTRERQRRLDMERHKQTIRDVDSRYARIQSGNALASDNMSNDAMKADQDSRRHAVSRVDEMQKEFSSGGYWENYRRERADADLVKSTNTFVGKRSTDEQIYRASRSMSSLGAITEQAGSRTSMQLESDVTAEKAKLTEQQEDIRQMAAGGLSTPAQEEAYRQAGIHHQESINRLGVLTGAQGKQGRDKTDLAGRQRSADSLVERVGRDSLKRDVADSIASGNQGSLQEESLKLDGIQDKIKSAAEAFEKALSGSGKEAEELGKELDKLGKEYDSQKAIVGGLGGGGSGEGISDKIARWSGTAGDVLQAGATGIKTIGVDQELRDVANRTGYAAISNRQFQDHQSALGGDMAALRRMETDQYGKAAHEAGFLGALAAASVAASGVADTAAIGGVVAKNAGNLSSTTNAGSALSEVASVSAQRGVGALAKGTDVARGISGGETRIQAFQAYMRLSDEEKRVQDTSMQAYRDTMGGNTLATRGAGSGRGALFGQMNDPASRMALAKLGMGADQMQSTYAQGISGMGADFRGNDAAGMVKRSAELQRSGMMNAEQYMSNVGQLNAIGGNASGNMETIMKNAVSNGMDSSRNIQQMVAGISGLSSQSAMMGISTAAGATNAMGLALDTEALRSLPNKAMAADAAASQIGKMNNSMSDSSMNLFNVAESFALREAAPDVSDAQIARMQKLTATELAEIQKDPEAAKKFGLGFLGKDKSLLKKVSGIVTRTESNKAGGLILSEEARAAMNEQHANQMPQKEFEAKYPKLSQEIIAAKGLSHVNAAITDPFLANLGAGEAASAKDLPTGDKKTNAAEGVLAKQFEAMEKLNTDGQKAFKDLYGGISEFNKKLEPLLKEFSPENYKAQAGTAAEGSMQTKGFDGSVSNFAKAVDAFVAGVRDKVGGTQSSEEVMKNKRKSNEVFDKYKTGFGGGM